jgi:hypothetical protein
MQFPSLHNYPIQLMREKLLLCVPHDYVCILTQWLSLTGIKWDASAVGLC